MENEDTKEDVLSLLTQIPEEFSWNIEMCKEIARFPNSVLQRKALTRLLEANKKIGIATVIEILQEGGLSINEAIYQLFNVKT